MDPFELDRNEKWIAYLQTEEGKKSLEKKPQPRDSRKIVHETVLEIGRIYSVENTKYNGLEGVLVEFVYDYLDGVPPGERPFFAPQCARVKFPGRSGVPPCVQFGDLVEVKRK